MLRPVLVRQPLSPILRRPGKRRAEAVRPDGGYTVWLSLVAAVASLYSAGSYCRL